MSCLVALSKCCIYFWVVSMSVLVWCVLVVWASIVVAALFVHVSLSSLLAVVLWKRHARDRRVLFLWFLADPAGQTLVDSAAAQLRLALRTFEQALRQLLCSF